MSDAANKQTELLGKNLGKLFSGIGPSGQKAMPDPVPAAEAPRSTYQGYLMQKQALQGSKKNG